MSDRTAADMVGGSPGQQAADASRKLYDASGEVIQQGAQQAEATTDQIAQFIQEQPMTAALAALVIGYILGKIT